MEENMQRTKKVMYGIVLIVALAIAATWYCTRKQNPSTFRVGFNTWVGYGPFYVAKEKGFFKEEGLDVDLQRIEGTGDRRAALIAGRVEALGSTVDDLVVGASQGVPAKMVLGIDQSNGADGIVAVNSIKDIKDLKGKTIAVQPGFVNHFFLLYLLDKNGLSPNDVKIEAMEPDAAGLAFVAKKIDVAVTFEPHLSEAKKRPDGSVLITSAAPIAEGVIVDNFIVRNDVIQSRRGDVEKFIRAWFKAVQYCKSNPDDANAIIAKAFDLKPSEIPEMLAGVKLFDEGMNKKFLSLSGEPHTVLEIAGKAGELYFRAGLITNRPDARTLVDTSFVK
jgi:NitT/TauT family transport system substrate-binding protein